jgi:hypothetical protein
MSYTLTAISQKTNVQVEPGPMVGTAGQTVQVNTDLTGCTTSVEVTTNRFDSASKMVFETVEESGIALESGSAVQFNDNGTPVFAGFIFTAERSFDHKVTYTAYDQLYYLKAKASYTFVNMSLEQIITQVATDFNLTVGTLEPTGYVFPCLIKENTEILGMIFEALSQVIVQTGEIFVFYDNFGKLELKNVKNMFVNALLGNNSLVTDYTYKRDMASDTYNRIKLVRPNKETGRMDAFVHEDTETQKKWGLLQYYDSVDENLNDAQIDAMCAMYLQYYNRLLQSVKISAIGIPGLRAGNVIPVRITQVSELSSNRILLAEKVSHKYEGNAHTMDIEVKNFEQLGGASWI